MEDQAARAAIQKMIPRQRERAKTRWSTRTGEKSLQTPANRSAVVTPASVEVVLDADYQRAMQLAPNSRHEAKKAILIGVRYLRAFESHHALPLGFARFLADAIEDALRKDGHKEQAGALMRNLYLVLDHRGRNVDRLAAGTEVAAIREGYDQKVERVLQQARSLPSKRRMADAVRDGRETANAWRANRYRELVKKFGVSKSRLDRYYNEDYLDAKQLFEGGKPRNKKPQRKIR